MESLISAFGMALAAGLISGSVMLIAGLMIEAFALDTACAIVRGWVWTYTRALPKHNRLERQALIESDLWEQKNSDKEEGYQPKSIAFRIVGRCLLGVP